MATKSDSKKQLEANQDQKTGDVAVGFFPSFGMVAVSTITRGVTTMVSTPIALPNRCFRNQVLDVSGFATTADNGQSLIRLTKFICPKGEVFHLPINVVATPDHPKPCFLTISQSLLNNGADVEIRVFAWDTKGAAAQGVRFNWRCRVELN
ncbi:MAG: hypothetical protein AABN34_29215 [Acidobacteriota bacterium]